MERPYCRPPKGDPDHWAAFLFSKQRSKAMHECEICGNVFEIEWIAKGKDYNDFGHWYCPFCGAIFDSFITDEDSKR
jgi:hypothetical protein